MNLAFDPKGGHIPVFPRMHARLETNQSHSVMHSTGYVNTYTSDLRSQIVSYSQHRSEANGQTSLGDGTVPNHAPQTGSNSAPVIPATSNWALLPDRHPTSTFGQPGLALRTTRTRKGAEPFTSEMACSLRKLETPLLSLFAVQSTNSGVI